MSLQTTSNSLLLSVWNKAPKTNLGPKPSSTNSAGKHQIVAFTDDYDTSFTLNVVHSWEGTPQIEADYGACEITAKNKNNVSWLTLVAAIVIRRFHPETADTIIRRSMACRTQRRLADMGIEVNKSDPLKITLKLFFEQDKAIAKASQAKIEELNSVATATVNSSWIHNVRCPATKKYLTVDQAVVLEYGNKQIIMSRDGISKVLINNCARNQYDRADVVTREQILHGSLKPLTRVNCRLNSYSEKSDPRLVEGDGETVWTWIPKKVQGGSEKILTKTPEKVQNDTK